MENDLFGFGLMVGSLSFMAGLCLGMLAICAADYYAVKNKVGQKRSVEDNGEAAQDSQYLFKSEVTKEIPKDGSRSKYDVTWGEQGDGVEIEIIVRDKIPYGRQESHAKSNGKGA